MFYQMGRILIEDFCIVALPHIGPADTTHIIVHQHLAHVYPVLRLDLFHHKRFALDLQNRILGGNGAFSRDPK